MSVRPHISFSEWVNWNECQWRWLKDYREGKRAPIYSVHLVFGTAIHSACETLKNPELNDDRPSVEQVCHIFEDKFKTSYLKIRDKDKKPLSDEEIDSLVEAGKTIIKNLDDCKELANVQALFIEYPLMEKIDRTDDVQIKFKGYIDIIIKTKDKRGKSVIYICDYKTCSWGWNREKKTDESLMAQLRLYKHFFSKKFKLDPKNVKTAFILLKKKPTKGSPAAEWLPISAGPKTMMRAVNKLNEAITGMQTNDYKKNRNACINKFGDTCPYFNSPDCTED